MFKEIYEDDVLLDVFRKNTKYNQNNQIIIEHELDPRSHKNTQILVQFVKVHEDRYFSSTIKNSFTFIRPFILPKMGSAIDIHLAVFRYLKNIFDRKISEDNEEYSADSKNLSVEDLYQKYILKSNKPPYSLSIETDSSNSYFKKPCS